MVMSPITFFLLSLGIYNNGFCLVTDFETTVCENKDNTISVVLTVISL